MSITVTGELKAMSCKRKTDNHLNMNGVPVGTPCRKRGNENSIRSNLDYGVAVTGRIDGSRLLSHPTTAPNSSLLQFKCCVVQKQQ